VRGRASEPIDEPDGEPDGERSGGPAAETAREPAGEGPLDRPLIFVTVGTDHHPFPRMLRWVRNWAAEHPRWQLEVQHGATAAPPFGHAFAYTGHEEMRGLFRRAAVVVCHAGPATITQARAFRHVPVVVARDPTLGEHVDDHQILFSRRLAAAGLIWLAESEAGLGRAIAAALAAAAGPVEGDRTRNPPGVYQVAEVVEKPVESSRGQQDRGPRAPGRRVARSRQRH
jgi:UDP-N-acetylglucosamine transferase subunit ALG13